MTAPATRTNRTGSVSAPETVQAAAPRKTGRIHELDVLRFFAAFAVVVHHYHEHLFGWGQTMLGVADPISRFGYLGVELFFMISGFVILMSAEGRTTKQFAISRFVRLYPTYWLAIGLTTVVMVATGAGPPIGDVVANLTMLHTYLGVEHLDGTYWSLVVEMRFYLLMAIAIRLGLLDRIEDLLLGWMCFAAVRLLVQPPDFIDQLLLSRYAHLFIAGAVFYLVWRDHAFTGRRVGLLVLAVVLGVRYAGFDAAERAIDHSASFPSWQPRVAVVLFFATFLVISWNGIPGLRGRNLATLGAITYPLYLLHHMIGRRLFEAWNAEPYVMLVVMTAGMVLVSHLIARYFEAPVGRTLKKKLTP